MGIGGKVPVVVFGTEYTRTKIQERLIMEW
jgi:hypothetical protein